MRSADKVGGQFPSAHRTGRAWQGGAIPSISVGLTGRRSSAGIWVCFYFRNDFLRRPFFLRPGAIEAVKQGRDRPHFRRTPHPLLFLKQIHSNFLLSRQRFPIFLKKPFVPNPDPVLHQRYTVFGVAFDEPKQFVDDGLRWTFWF